MHREEMGKVTVGMGNRLLFRDTGSESYVQTYATYAMVHGY